MTLWVYGFHNIGMKTTVDISDNLLRRAKKLARERSLTLKALIEEGLELVLGSREHRKPYKVKPVVFSGKGISPEFQQASWADIRRAAYEGRGG